MASIRHQFEITLDEREYDHVRGEARNLGLSLEGWIRRRLGIGGDKAAPTRRVTAAAPPAPAEPKAQTPPPTRDPLGVPIGFAAIVATVSEFAAGREEAIQASNGATTGRAYNLWIRDWYRRQGYAEMPSHQRSTLVALRRQIDEITAYANRHPQYFDDPRLTPQALSYRWEHRPKEPLRRKVVGFSELRKSAKDPPPPLRAPVFDGKGEMRWVDPEELFKKPEGKAEEEDKAGDELPPVGSFAEIELDQLEAYGERILRRFAGRLIHQGEVSERMPPEEIAATIERIRGKEKGNTPRCAETLVQLGVMWGNSGQYKIRPEFAERFDEVARWAMLPASS
jgi:hypothetical protein